MTTWTNTKTPFRDMAAHWKLEDATDSAGTNTLTLTNTSVVTGSNRNALDFNGTTAYASAADATALRIETNNAFTVAFWVYLDAYDNNVLPRLWEKNAQYMAIMGNSGNGKFRRLAIEVQASSDNGNGNAGASEFWGSTQLQLSTWYHVVGTFDGNLVGNEPTVYQGKIYLNGVAETMDTIFAWSGTLQTTSGQAFYLARRHTDQARNLDGRLDDFRVWTRALEPEEVRAVYSAATQRTLDKNTTTWTNNSKS